VPVRWTPRQEPRTPDAGPRPGESARSYYPGSRRSEIRAKAAPGPGGAGFDHHDGHLGRRGREFLSAVVVHPWQGSLRLTRRPEPPESLDNREVRRHCTLDCATCTVDCAESPFILRAASRTAAEEGRLRRYAERIRVHTMTTKAMAANLRGTTVAALCRSPRLPACAGNLVAGRRQLGPLHGATRALALNVANKPKRLCLTREARTQMGMRCSTRR
jgi:hypothetical protein